jgi:hypothetical protein
MEDNKILKHVKSGLFAFYYLTFFMTIYKAVVLGVTYKVSISNLNAGGTFKIVFLVAIVATIIAMYMKENLGKIFYMITLVLMFLFLLILLLLKEDGTTIRIAFYLQVLILGALIFAKYGESKTLEITKLGIEQSKKLFGKVMDLVKKAGDEPVEEEVTKENIE